MDFRHSIPRIRGHYYECRHYSKVTETQLYCSKHKRNRKTCEGCMTCPKCASIMYTYKIDRDIYRDRVFITHAKSCALCGAYIEEHYIMLTQTQQIKKPLKEGQCQVHGCKHTAFEGYQHNIEHEGEVRQFTICVTHKRRLKTWRLHPEKGQEQEPLMFDGSTLYDNPDYVFKQGKRNDPTRCDDNQYEEL